MLLVGKQREARSLTMLEETADIVFLMTGIYCPRCGGAIHADTEQEARAWFCSQCKADISLDGEIITRNAQT